MLDPISRKLYTCAFTGHRTLPYKLDAPECLRQRYGLQAAILEAYEHDRCDTFLCGMALGADLLFAEEVLKLATDGLPMALIAAIPSHKQTERWSAENRARYERVLSKCESIHVEDETGMMNFPAACLRRNEWMVKNAKCLIAVYDGREKGGTARTVAYAQAMSLKVHVLRPVVSI